MTRLRKSPVASSSRIRALGGSLFDRLVADEEEVPVNRGYGVADARIMSIKRNLNRILNARVGGAASNPGLGVIDMNDGAVRSNDMIRHIAESIRICIEQGEPRVSDIKVSFLADPDAPLSLHFAVSALVRGMSPSDAVRIDLHMNDNRRFDIR